jgi:hypothetical protein
MTQTTSTPADDYTLGDDPREYPTDPDTPEEDDDDDQQVPGVATEPN